MTALCPGRLPGLPLIGMVPLIADVDVLERRKICPFWDSFVPTLGQLLYYQPPAHRFYLVLLLFIHSINHSVENFS